MQDAPVDPSIKPPSVVNLTQLSTAAAFVAKLPAGPEPTGKDGAPARYEIVV
jgi:hypothetical protein